MSDAFKRTIEDFTCERCGYPVQGTGYTNHCPKCLWSRHVDIYPGDRSAECGGMMEPVGVEKKGDRYALIHRCVRCGYVRRNIVLPEDDFEKVLEIAKKQSKEY